MTQEDKELLLKDLCARLPYGVHVLVKDTFKYSTVPFNNTYLKASDIPALIDSISLDERYNKKDKRFNKIIKEHKDFLEFKPCLFPFSSITKEQKEELNEKFNVQFSGNSIYSIHYHSEGCWDTDLELDLQDWLWFINWCYKNHVDINGLIEKGLAIDATGLNIY